MMIRISYNEKPIPDPFVIYVQNFDFDRYMEYANEDIDCELIDGVLVIHSPASLQHELIFKFLLNLLDLYTQHKKLGLVLGSRFTMRLSNSWAPEPDILFIENDQKKALKDTYLEGPATTIFEILSPATRDDDINKKLPKYLEFGVKEVWIVDPIGKTVECFSGNGRSREFSSNEWAISDAIPGFKFKPAWLWDISDVQLLEKFEEIIKKA